MSHEHAEKSWAKYDNDLFQTGRLIVRDAPQALVPVEARRNLKRLG